MTANTIAAVKYAFKRPIYIAAGSLEGDQNVIDIVIAQLDTDRTLHLPVSNHTTILYAEPHAAVAQPCQCRGLCPSDLILHIPVPHTCTIQVEPLVAGKDVFLRCIILIVIQIDDLELFRFRTILAPLELAVLYRDPGAGFDEFDRGVCTVQVHSDLVLFLDKIIL